MTTTDQELRAVTFLAIACRPNGARRWDHAGTYAALCRVRDRSLPEIALAAIRAASDRNVDTPGVIPTPGSHWAESATVRAWQPVTHPVGTRCTVCGGGGHAFTDHAFSTPRETDVDEWRGHVADLRSKLEPLAGPTERRGPEEFAEADPDLHQHVERARALVPTTEEDA